MLDFRAELSRAIADSTYPVFASRVGAGGLPLQDKRTAVEISLNFLVVNLKRLPPKDRAAAVRNITNRLHQFVSECN